MRTAARALNRKKEKRKETKAFLLKYRTELEAVKASVENVESQLRRKLIFEFKMRKAQDALEKGILPTHDICEKWEFLHKKGVKAELKEIMPLVEMKELFELKELVKPEERTDKYFDEEYMKQLSESLGSEELATAYIMGIRRTVNKIEDPELRKNILQILVENAKVPTATEKRRERVISSLNSMLEGM